MLETRIVTPKNIFSNNQKLINQNKLQTILSQEQKWADEANLKREKILKTKENIKNAIILSIIIIKKVIRYHKEIKQHPILKPQMEIQYFRDIPDESETPARSRIFVLF